MYYRPISQFARLPKVMLLYIVVCTPLHRWSAVVDVYRGLGLGKCVLMIFMRFQCEWGGGGAREGARYFFYEMNLLCCCWTSNGNVWHCCLPVYKRTHDRVWISPDRTEMVLLLGRFFFYRTFSDTIKKTETRLFDDSFDLNAPVVKTLALGKKKFDGSLCGPPIRSRWCIVCDSTLILFLQTLLLCMCVDGIMADCS
jgi:hypothetical protein